MKCILRIAKPGVTNNSILCLKASCVDTDPPGKLLGLSSTHDAHIGPKKLLSSLQSLERDTLLILNCGIEL